MQTTTTKKKILGVGKFGTPPITTIDDFLYFEGLKHNLLSIGQLCDKGLKINFNREECIIKGEGCHSI